jgi:hypothetical protein
MPGWGGNKGSVFPFVKAFHSLRPNSFAPKAVEMIQPHLPGDSPTGSRERSDRSARVEGVGCVARL